MKAMIAPPQVYPVFIPALFEMSSDCATMRTGKSGTSRVCGSLKILQPRMTSTPGQAQNLLPRIAEGEAAAVNECLQRYSPLVWSMARKFWRDMATVEDLVQEIFIEVWKSASRFDAEKASETTFISTIARRRMIDRQRRQGSAIRTEPVEDLPIGAEDRNLEAIDVLDEASVVYRALETLKPDQRRVILLSVVEGLTHPEISDKTGIPLGTVKSHIRRGLSEAAQMLRSQEKGGDHDR